jgi:hypothetical protein
MPHGEFLSALDRVPGFNTKDMILDLMDGSKTYTFDRLWLEVYRYMWQSL